jgi:hypothetical protein
VKSFVSANTFVLKNVFIIAKILVFVKFRRKNNNYRTHISNIMQMFYHSGMSPFCEMVSASTKLFDNIFAKYEDENCVSSLWATHRNQTI